MTTTRPLHAEMDPVTALAAIRAASDHDAAADFIYRCVGLAAIQVLWSLAYGRRPPPLDRMSTSWPAIRRLAEALRDERTRVREVLDETAAGSGPLAGAAQRTIERAARRADCVYCGKPLDASNAHPNCEEDAEDAK